MNLEKKIAKLLWYIVHLIRINYGCWKLDRAQADRFHDPLPTFPPWKSQSPKDQIGVKFAQAQADPQLERPQNLPARGGT